MAVLSEIHPITWASINSKFRNSIAHRFAITEKTQANTLQSCQNAALRFMILQGIDPFLKGPFTVRRLINLHCPRLRWHLLDCILSATLGNYRLRS